MALAQWSWRRVAVMWAAGLALQAAFLVGPALAMRRALHADAGYIARLQRDLAARRERWAVTEAADARWTAEQRARGPRLRSPVGDTLYAVVRVIRHLLETGSTTPDRRRGAAGGTARIGCTRWRSSAAGTILPVPAATCAATALGRWAPTDIEVDVREYRYPATEATIAALRRLRDPWAGYHRTEAALVVAFADGSAVRVGVEGATVEPDFEAFRLTAAPVEVPAAALTPPGTFGTARNDVVVFTSETWIEGPGASELAGAGPDAVVQFTGSQRQRSSAAAAVCAVDDALVVATAAGTGALIRCGLRPATLEVTMETTEIAQFLTERQYGADAPDT